jgi:4a-hydroxytetrahydrobiopterin dehydratase
MKQAPHGWNQQNDHLTLQLACQDFKRAVALLNTIGDIAEKQNHHPDLAIKDYNHLYVSITTHDKGGLTDKDYTLAQAITDLLDYYEQKEDTELNGRKE